MNLVAEPTHWAFPSELQPKSGEVPFDLSVTANDAFYVACRPAMRSTPIVRVFIDWIFASLEPDHLAEPQTSAHRLLRSRRG